LKTLGFAGGVVLGGGAQEAVATPPASGASPGAAQPARPAGAREPLYVVINHEEQYSIWPAGLAPPRGWKPAGRPATLQATASKIDAQDKRSFQVVINHEEQYSIWPADQPLPPGFEARIRDCQPTDCVRSLSALERRPERPR
jgi:MbtH protein